MLDYKYIYEIYMYIYTMLMIVCIINLKAAFHVTSHDQRWWARRRKSEQQKTFFSNVGILWIEVKFVGISVRWKIAEKVAILIN